MLKIREQIVEVLANVLDIPALEIPSDAAPGVIEKWDSLTHMLLVMSLEEEFEIRFSDDELTDLLSLDLIIQIIVEKIGGDK